jgi:hypothetical protein
MFETESPTMTESPRGSSPPTLFPFTTEHKVSSDNDKYTPAERQELLEMTRRLRQAKRRLFLKSAAQPADSVERFREILMRISFEEPEFGCPDDDDMQVVIPCRRSQSSSVNSGVTQE